MLRRQADLLVGVLILLLVVGMVLGARDWDNRARLFPLAIGFPAIALSLLQIGLALRNLARERRTHAIAVSAVTPAPASTVAVAAGGESDEAAVVARAVESAFGAGSQAAAEEDIPPEIVRRRTIEMAGWLILMTLGIYMFGFQLGAALLTIAFLRIAAHERWAPSLLLALGIFLFFYLVFDLGLNIPFPNGWLADWLGIESLDSYLTKPITRLITGAA